MFTRTGDPDPNKVADAGVIPPRGLSPAEGLHGAYRETTSFTDGTVLPGNSACPTGNAQVTITAEYPMPQTLDDPISVLNGRGTQTIAAGSPCTGGGDFEDRFERTGD